MLLILVCMLIRVYVCMCDMYMCVQCLVLVYMCVRFCIKYRMHGGDYSFCGFGKFLSPPNLNYAI